MQINYKSDFDFILNLVDWDGNTVPFPDWNFEVRVFTDEKRVYKCFYKNGVYTNLYNDEGRIHIVCNAHKLRPGQVSVEFYAEIPNTRYPDASKLTVGIQPTEIELVESNGEDTRIEEVATLIAPYVIADAYTIAVMAGYTGSRDEYISALTEMPQSVSDVQKAIRDITEKQNEVSAQQEEWIASEEERKLNEEKRQSNEEDRQSNEAVRNVNETLRQSSENQRKDKEQERQQNEEDRQSNEATRKKNVTELLENANKKVNEAVAQANEATENANQSEEERQQAYEELKADVTQVIQETENIAIEIDDSVISITNKAGETSKYDVALSKVNAELDGSVVRVTDKEGNVKEIDLLDATEERVVVQLHSDVEGVSTAGLVLNVYYNDTDTPVQYTTDERGTAVFKVENGNKYRIVYPDVEGCNPIPDVEYVAAASERTITEWYKTTELIDSETVFFSFRLYYENQTTSEPYTNGKATITYGDVEEVLTADSNGQARTTVPLGTEYTVTIEKPSDCHLMGGRYVHTYKADKTQRAIIVNLHEYLSSFLVVDKDGGEWTLDAWQQSGRDNSEAVLIHVCTDELLQNNGDFLLSVDGLRERKYDYNEGSYGNFAWSQAAVEFTSIPLNGNNKTADYYYDGLTASQLIIGEGVEKGILTPAFNKVESEHFELGANNLQAFIGSVGQWNALINNATYIDELLAALRPDGTYLYSDWTANKWTSTQQSATNAYLVTRVISHVIKRNGSLAVPFYAPISL